MRSVHTLSSSFRPSKLVHILLLCSFTLDLTFAPRRPLLSFHLLIIGIGILSMHITVLGVGFYRAASQSAVGQIMTISRRTKTATVRQEKRGTTQTKPKIPIRISQLNHPCTSTTLIFTRLRPTKGWTQIRRMTRKMTLQMWLWCRWQIF